MTILASELKFYKSATVNDTTANGGVMATNEITDNLKNNLWPDVPAAERTAGSVKYRKIFLKVANDDDLTFYTPLLFVETPTPGGDRVVIHGGTQTNTRNDLTGTERLYGNGRLNANLQVGATSLTVATELGADLIFQNGDLIRISDKTSVDDPNGNEEFIRLAASNAVSWNGDLATLTLESGKSVANAYQATTTRVASCIETSDIKTSFDNWTESSSAGTYNEATYPPLLDNISGIEETWTLTFSTATTFTCSGSLVGSVGSGTTTGDFAPNNPTYSKPYFTLRSAGWGGTWATNDTLALRTHPAATAIWEKRIVPAGCASLTGNKVVIGVSGESE